MVFFGVDSNRASRIHSKSDVKNFIVKDVRLRFYETSLFTAKNLC